MARGRCLRGACDWSEQSSAGIDHAEEMELLLENCHRLAEDLAHAARELRALIDDSQSVIFLNLDRWARRRGARGEVLLLCVGVAPEAPGALAVGRGPADPTLSRSHRNVMMRLNLQLTMGTFSLSLFGLIGVAFGMNLESSLEEVRMSFSKLGVLFSRCEGPFLKQTLNRKSSLSPPSGHECVLWPVHSQAGSRPVSMARTAGFCFSDCAAWPAGGRSAPGRRHTVWLSRRL